MLSYERVLRYGPLMSWFVSGEPVCSNFPRQRVARSAGKVVEELTLISLCSVWVCRGSNLPVLLTPSITQKRLLTGVNKTKLLL